MTQWYIAIREIRRNGMRSVLIALSVCTAAAVMMAVVLLILGVNQSIGRTVKRLGADLMVIPKGDKVAKDFNEALITGKPAAFYLESTISDELSRMPGIKQVSAQTFAQTLTNARCCAGEFFIVGFDPESDFTVSPWLSRDISHLPLDSGNWALVGDRILLRKGDTIHFYGTSFTVAGVLQPTSTGMDWTVYVPDAALRNMVSGSKGRAEAPLRIPPGTFSAIFIKAAPKAELIDLAETIEQSHPNTQAVLSSSVAKLARGQMSTVAVALLCIVAALWVMALLLNGIVFSQAVRERQSEIGLLIAKGADKSFVFGLLAKEAGCIALTSSVLGCAVGLLAVVSSHQLLAKILSISDALPTVSITVALVVAFVGFGTSGSIIAALLPVRRLLETEPYEAIKQGAIA